jgi:hypothetical protein
MFKALGLNLGNFLFKKPLRWAFSQAFGSKMKDWFDNNIAVAIDLAIASGVFNPASAAIKFIEGDYIDSIFKQAVSELNIPKNYQGLAKDYIKDKVKEQIKKGFEVKLEEPNTEVQIAEEIKS